MKLTQKLVRKLFDYHKNGFLTWQVKRPNIAIGDVAGGINSKGYCQISIDGKHYLRSRLTFLYHHGYMPENDVDHRNRKTKDDRIENLREISDQCNQRNCGNPTTKTMEVIMFRYMLIYVWGQQSWIELNDETRRLYEKIRVFKGKQPR